MGACRIAFRKNNYSKGAGNPEVGARTDRSPVRLFTDFLTRLVISPDTKLAFRGDALPWIHTSTLRAVRDPGPAAAPQARRHGAEQRDAVRAVLLPAERLVHCTWRWRRERDVLWSCTRSIRSLDTT